jgi:Domain of unknown function (DU1801)
MTRTGPSQAVYDLLAPYSPEVRNLALATREYLLKLIPGATEQPDAKAKIIGYGFGARYKDMVCALMPTKAGITLGIGWATELPDPEKLLEGTGRVHRHVKIKNKSDLRAPSLKTLLKAAHQATLERREKTGN